jgi:hypothetical protein
MAFMQSTALRFAAFLALWATFSACGGDSPAGITDPGKKDTTTTPVPPVTNTARVNVLLNQIVNANAAASQGNSASGIPSSIPEPGYSAAGASFATAPDNSALCVLDSLTVRFNCPSQTAQNGVVTTMYFQLLDGDGKPMLGFDTLKTVSVRRVSDKVGSYSSPLMTVSGPIPAIDSINNHEDMLLAAAKDAPHKLNGTGLMKVVIAAEGRTPAYITAPTTTENVGFFTDSTKHYPNSGKVTAIVSTIQAGSNTATTTQVTSYDGTPIAKLVITGQFGLNRTCTYDMTSPIPPVCTP